jgi:hypothetical protein
MGNIPGQSTGVETSRSGFFDLFNRGNLKDKQRVNITTTQPTETVFAVGDSPARTPLMRSRAPSPKATSSGISPYDKHASLSTIDIKNK